MQRSEWTFLAACFALSTAPACNAVFGITEGEPRDGSAASGAGGLGGSDGQGGAGGQGGSGGPDNTGGEAGGTSDVACPDEPFTGRAPDECETDGAHDYLADNENCCVRGRSCLGGDCVEGRCSPVPLAEAHESEALGIAVEGDGRDDRVFWAGGSSNAVYASQKEANGRTTTLTTRSSYVTMLEREANRLFLTDWASSSVFRVPLQGSIAVQTVANGAAGSAIAAKPVAGHGWVYWITGVPQEENQDPADYYTLKRIWAARADDTEQAAMMVMDRNVHVSALALDDTHLYWTEFEFGGTEVSVRRVKHGELGETELVTTNTVAEHGWVGDIAVTDRVYWVVDGDIWVIDKSGDASTKGMLAPGSYAESILVDATHVYWFGSGVGQVQRVLTSGGEVETLAETTTRVRALAQDCRAIYWTQEPEWSQEGEQVAPAKVHMLAK
jgi:hypothetical protein